MPYDDGMGNRLTWKTGGSCYLIGMVRDGRPCNPHEILTQIGAVRFAVSGGRWAQLEDTSGSVVGIVLPITFTRRIEIILDFSDTYIVRHIRYITRGKQAHSEVVEREVTDVYCDQLARVVLDFSTWEK
jgi:hypothetical protein